MKEKQANASLFEFSPRRYCLVKKSEVFFWKKLVFFLFGGERSQNDFKKMIFVIVKKIWRK
jgi:hypothetical protein